MPHQTRIRSWDLLPLATLLAGAVALSLIGFSSWLTERSSRETALLAPLTHAVGLRIGAARLWSARALAGSGPADAARQADANFDGVVHLLAAALAGGTHAAPGPLSTHVRQLRGLVEELRALVAKRFADPTSTDAGNLADRRLDLAFQRLTALDDQLSGEIVALAGRRRDEVQELNGLVAGMTFLLFGAIATFARRARLAGEKQRQELAARVVDRTSELRDSEERMQTIVDNAADGVVTLDELGVIESCNPAAERIFGRPAAEMLGRSVESLVPERLRGLLSGGVTSFLEGQGPLAGRPLEVVGLRRDGSEVALELAVSEFKLGGRRVWIGLVRDITERKRYQRLILRAKEDAELAARVKGEFLANMSHEIRTPLNAVIGLTGLLLDTPLEPQQQDYVETLRTSAGALLEIVNQILDFSKIEAGRMDLDEVSFDPRRCVEDALDLMAVKAAEKGLDLVHHLSPGVPESLIGDGSRVRQVLLNLVANAVKFTERGKIEVLVSAEPEGERFRVSFAVRDSGIGIPPDRMDRLFHSFSQVDASTTRRYGGTGLGLAISKRIAEAMGGSIRVESEVGKGSLFDFTILAAAGDPIAAARPERARLAEPSAPPAPPRDPAPVSSWRAPAGLRVLLVEDNLVNQKVGSRILERHGVRADLAANGREALAALARQPYDVVFMDVQMPEMDGMEATRHIRAQLDTPRPWIVAMTAGALDGDRDRCLQAGMDDYVSKPVQLADVVAALRRHERARSVREPLDDPGNRAPFA